MQLPRGRRAVPGLIAASLLLALACGPAFKAPKVELRGVSVKTADDISVRLMFQNPNSFGISVTGLEYRVAIETLICGSGRRDELLRVGAGDSAAAEFPLHLDYSNLARSLPLLLADSVSLRIDGTYSLHTVIGPQQLGFRQEKRLALKAQLESVLRQFFK